MKKVIFAVISVVIVFFIVRGVQGSIERSKTTALTIESIQAEQGIPVTVIKASQKNIKSFRTFTGSLRGIEQSDATAFIAEKVLKINVTVGKRVREGDLLLTLDNKTTSAYRQITDALADAKQDRDRAKELLKAGAISQQMLDKAELGVKMAQSEMDALLIRHRVSAPISGIVTDVYAEKGVFVAPGLPLVRIAKLDRMILEIQVAETDIALVKQGQSAVVTARSYPGKEFSGTVKEIALSTNPGKRNFNIEIEIPNPDMILKSGMFATANLIITESLDAVTVPSDALINENGSYYLYLVNSNNTVKKVAVTPKITEGEFVEIPNGISSDDIIVIEGQNKLSDGVKIKVVS
jgi:membrane fusion protein (multidrug efflux system)